MTLPKPKDVKRKRAGKRENKDGSVVCKTDNEWRKVRWDLYVISNSCFRCGCRLEFGATTPFSSGGEPGTNFHAHHSRGTRGLGGGKRDDRIYIPGTFDPTIWDDYPFMPEPPEGMVFNLYALCNECHRLNHHQGCSGQPQWSGHATRKETDEGAEVTDTIAQAIAAAAECCDRTSHGAVALRGSASAEGDD